MAGNVRSRVRLNNVVVPHRNVLTRGEDGFAALTETLNWERIGAAVFLNTIARVALDMVLGYTGTRDQFRRPIGKFRGIGRRLAGLSSALTSSRALAFRTGQHGIERPPSGPGGAAMAKLRAAQVAHIVVSTALQLHGANGRLRGHPLESLFGFARGYRIAGGTDGILQNTIARSLTDGEVRRVL